MAGDVYPVPLGHSHTRGGGSVRLNFVSVDTPLCDGPRNAGQSLVIAPVGSGLGFRCTRVCPGAALTIIRWPARAWSNERRDIKTIAPASYQRPMRTSVELRQRVRSGSRHGQD